MAYSCTDPEDCIHPHPSEDSNLSLNFQKIGIGKDLHPHQIIPRNPPPLSDDMGGGGVWMCGWLSDI